jgi:hypothetical protein
MATLSLGSGLRTNLATALFATTTYSTGGGSAGNTGTATTGGDVQMYPSELRFLGLGGSKWSGSVSISYYPYSTFIGPVGNTYFSLMKGVVPSAIADVSSNQRASDEIIRYSTNLTTSSVDGSYRISYDYIPSKLGVSLVNAASGDFLVTQDGATVAWNPVGVAFSPRACIRTGTPTWFWFRTNNNEHTIYGTVGATGSGADLEIDNYGSLSGTVSIYNSTILRFSVGNTASWSS